MTVFFCLSNKKTLSTFDIETTQISACVDETFNAYTKCGISYFSTENITPTFTSSNTDVLTIEKHSGLVVCLIEGTAKITVELQTNDQPLVEEILVNVTEKVVYPKTMEITYSKITLNGSNDIAINPLILDETTLTPEVWSENNFAQYDYTTGKVTASKSDTIHIQISKNAVENITISFQVIVEETKITEITETMQINKTKKISYTLDMLSAENQSLSTPKVEDASVIQILQSNVGYVRVKALRLGKTTITISIGSQTLLIHVTVVE